MHGTNDQASRKPLQTHAVAAAIDRQRNDLLFLRPIGWYCPKAGRTIQSNYGQIMRIRPLRNFVAHATGSDNPRPEPRDPHVDNTARRELRSRRVPPTRGTQFRRYQTAVEWKLDHRRSIAAQPSERIRIAETPASRLITHQEHHRSESDACSPQRGTNAAHTGQTGSGGRPSLA